MTQPQKATQSIPSKMDEQILVIKRSTLLPGETWNGIRKVNFEHYTSLIETHKEFHPRGIMEADPTYKQIIPYLVFTYGGKLFVMQRDKKASETRLQSKFSLGIGGHIRKSDMQTNSIIDWATREFYEEVSYDGQLTIEPLGILNDDSTEVGKVHIGFVFLLYGSHDQISIKSELQSGKLMDQDLCNAHRNKMETWSKFVLDYLATHSRVFSL